MSENVEIYKAASTVDCPIPDLLVRATTEFPWGDPAQSARLHYFGAKKLFDALIASLPGGTIDQLLVLLLEHRASLYRVPHQKREN